MNELDESYISNSYSEVHQSIGFPVLVYKSVSIRDAYNQLSVELTPASSPIYAMFVSKKLREADISKEDISDGDTESKALLKIVRRDLLVVGITKLEMKDVLDVTINGETTRYIVTGFSDRNEFPNVFVFPFVTRMSDVNVVEHNG